MRVINYTIYSGNPYHQAIYSALPHRYVPEKGDVDAAIEALKSGSKIFHIHWEEHCLRSCATVVEAEAAAQYFLKRLYLFKARGGKIVWTVHNSMPHEMQFPDVFLSLRQKIAATCDRILVHNLEAINVLVKQNAYAVEKIQLLPHPSYIGFYEPERPARAILAQVAPSRVVQAFGMIRRYKAFDRLLQDFDPAFAQEHNLKLRISGDSIANDSYTQELSLLADGRPEVELDFRKIPVEDVAGLLRSAACVVLPYERFLTSGVALLALTIGVPIVASRSRQLCELLPPSAQALLYTPNDLADFKRAILAAVDMTAEERLELSAGLVARAEYLSPQRISEQLGRIYDHLM